MSQPFHKPRRWDDPEVLSAVAGGLAGALTAVFVCPLDVLKTRLQVQRTSNVKYRSLAGGLTQIARMEGMRGLYRGLSPTLFALLPNWAVYFTVYEQLKIALNNKAVAMGYDGKPKATVHMLAAAGAGVGTLAFTNPLWVVKTRMQTQHMGLKMAGSRPMYTGTFNALFTIARTEGMAGLYSGLLPSMMGIFHVAIQFPLYEYFKEELAARDDKTLDKLTPLELVGASMLSKMIASTATYPHEVVRSHMHVAGTGPFDGMALVCRDILHQDGIKGFYRGCLTNLARTTPAAALTFTSFELINRNLRLAAGAVREKQPA